MWLNFTNNGTETASRGRVGRALFTDRKNEAARTLLSNLKEVTKIMPIATIETEQLTTVEAFKDLARS